MNCGGCGSKNAWAIRFRQMNGKVYEECSDCSDYRGSGVFKPDVFWGRGPHSIEHVTDEEGEPVQFRSPMHKARVFREKNLSEAGDKVGGVRKLPFHRHPRYRRPPDPSGAEAA